MRRARSRTSAQARAQLSLRARFVARANFMKNIHPSTVLRKALTIDCLARANDPTCAIGSARLIYSLKGLYMLAHSDFSRF